MGNMLILGPQRFAPEYLKRLKKKRAAIHRTCDTLAELLSLGVIRLVKQPQPWPSLIDPHRIIEISIKPFCESLEQVLSSDIDGVLEMAAQPPPKPTAEMLIQATRVREQLQDQLDRVNKLYAKHKDNEELTALVELMTAPLAEQLRLAEQQVSAIQRALEDQEHL